MKFMIMLIVIVFLSTAVVADDHFLCYSIPGNDLVFARIPDPGTYNDLEILYTLDGPYHAGALTYDGEYWWLEYYGDIYCFDENGDYVDQFPSPASYVRGMGWDGDYLWLLDQTNYTLYQRDANGDPGPYGQFNGYGDGYPASLTVAGDNLIVGETSFSYGYLAVYDFDGTRIDYFTFNGAHEYPTFYALAYYDGIVWAGYHDVDYTTNYHTVYGFEYTPGMKDNWDIVTTVNDEQIGALTVSDPSFLGVASSSLGKIKAYFNEE